MDRRHFLAIGGLFLLAPGQLLAGRTDPGPQNWLSCCSDLDGNHFLSLVDSVGTSVWDLALPERGHGIAADPAGNHVVVFARRPGAFFWVVDVASAAVVHKADATTGRHFYGHGVFTRDGSRLLSTENAYDSGDGVIGVYAVDEDFRRLGEIPSHGIGPHEIGLLSDGRTLVVANGGIRTHPDLPRVKQNLDTMRPNLAFVDSRSGELIRRFQPESRWHQLSLRHIDVTSDDRVVVVAQYEGRLHERPPLIALQHGDTELQWLAAPDAVQRRMRNYCGSVAFSTDGGRFAASCPRGGVITLWSADGTYIGSHTQPDGCGIAAADNDRGFIVSDGRGGIVRVGAEEKSGTRHRHADVRWDNHLVALHG